MKPITAQQALINLYNATRKAPLSLEEHDNNRAYLDVLCQVLNLKLEWTAPQPEKKEQKEEISNNETFEVVSDTTSPVSKKQRKQKKSV